MRCPSGRRLLSASSPAGRRDSDLALIGRTLTFYLQPKETPVTRTDGEAHWLANETRKFEDHYTAKVTGIEEKDGTAIATIEITGDDSDYGKLVPSLTVKAGQNYAEWNANNKLYKVWLEDNTSLEKRLELVDKNKLAGAAFWKLGFENSSIWDIVIKYLD